MWAATLPRGFESHPVRLAVSTRQAEEAAPRGFEPSDRRERARGAKRPNRATNGRELDESAKQVSQSHPVRRNAPLQPRKFDSRSPRGAPSPAAGTGCLSSFRQHPGGRHSERWQNGNAPVSKTGALTGLGVRIPPSPLRRGSNRANPPAQATRRQPRPAALLVKARGAHKLRDDPCAAVNR